MIILIDTYAQPARLTIANQNTCIASIEKNTLGDNLLFIEEINPLMQKANVEWKDIKTIAVIEGPGSYTGLRIGMAIAKTITYSLNIPLIMVNTLDVLANVVYRLHSNAQYVWAMLDAKRNEVFMAIYHQQQYYQTFTPTNWIYNADELKTIIADKHFYMIGNGVDKFKPLLTSYKNIDFIDIKDDFFTQSFMHIANIKYHKKDFANPLQAVPFYGKDVYVLHQ